MGIQIRQAASRTLFVRLFLFIIWTFALLRLVGFIFRFGLESLQMDFSAFYTAGQALNRDVSPYRNQVVLIPPVWDGVAQFTHSRFLYPPIVAVLFQPLALLPYAVAKFSWMLLNLACIGISMAITKKILRIQSSVNLVLIAAIFAMLFYPLLPYLERGQIDAIVLLFITIGLYLLLYGEGKGQFMAGLLFVMATVIKLHCIYLVPFLLIQKQWRVLVGYIVGGGIVLFLSVIINGADVMFDYLTVELPRITVYGEAGNLQMVLSPDSQAAMSASGMVEGYKEGKQYLPSFFNFSVNATIARNMPAIYTRLGIALSPSATSLLLFAAFFLIFFLIHQVSPINQKSDIAMQFLWWEAVLIVILLSAPLTWVMNTIWLIPLIWVVIYGYQSVNTPIAAVLLSIICIALLIAAIPDELAFSMLVPYGERYLSHKYVVSELLLVFSFIVYISQNRVLSKTDEMYS